MPRQLISEPTLRKMIVFDLEALRDDDLRPLESIPDDVN
jgi:hypothetical protein